MTNIGQIPGNKKRGGNIKDGHSPYRRQTKAQQDFGEIQWMDAGFIRQWIRDAARLTFTWEGTFPVFEVTPGIVTDGAGTHAGLVARYAPADIEILFAYGTSPSDIAARLNDEILAVMRHDADVDGLPLNWTPAGTEINIDDFMAGVGQ